MPPYPPSPLLVLLRRDRANRCVIPGGQFYANNIPDSLVMAGWSCKYVHVILDSFVLMGAVMAHQHGARGEELEEEAEDRSLSQETGSSGSEDQESISTRAAIDQMPTASVRAEPVREAPDDATPNRARDAGMFGVPLSSVARMSLKASTPSQVDSLATNSNSTEGGLEQGTLGPGPGQASVPSREDEAMWATL